MLSHLAWKNVWRNKVRSLVVLMAVASGVFGGIFCAAMMKGMVEQRNREAISREVSHIQIHHPAFKENLELKCTIPGYRQIVQKLNTLSQVDAWSSRLCITAMAATANNSAGVMAFGIDPVEEKLVSGIYSTICDSCGDYFNENKANQAVVGMKLARKLNLKLKSKLILTFQDIDGNLCGAAFRITGIYETSNSVFDESHIFLRKTDLAPLLKMDSSQCHEIAVRLKDEKDVPLVKESLAPFAKMAQIETWRELDVYLGMMDSLMDLYLYIIMAIILLALGFGIVNTMLMVVLERTRELGMLNCVGMDSGRIFRMIMLESVYMCLAGGMAGMIIAWQAISRLGVVGIDLSLYAEGLKSVGFNPVIYPALEWRYFIGFGIMIFLTGVLAAVYPGRKALKLRPAEAVRAD